MVTCAVTTSFLGCLVMLCLYFRYTWGINLTPFSRVLLLIPFLAAGCIPLMVSYDWQKYLGGFYPFYRYGLYFIYIGCVILLTVTVISDLLFWLAGRTAGIAPAKSAVNAGNLLVALAATIWALYAGVKVPALKEVEIASAKISAPLKIVVLSDLHIHRVICPEKIRRIIERANAENPDVILLAGDVIDDDVKEVSAITAQLKNLKAGKGIYFVTGNHEFYAGYKETVAELQNLGFVFLENNGQPVTPEVYLAGIPDLFTGSAFGRNADVKAAFKDAAAGQFRLLMSHTPGDFDENNREFDLEVSGHTHGGQIFPFHIFVKLGNKYLAGLYEMTENARIYVSSGAGQWGPQMRFLAPSEITVLNLVPEKKESTDK